jgi:hypothetical protein
MEALQRVIAKRRYNHYPDIPDFLEPVSHVFCTVFDPSYRMPRIRDITNVPISTVYPWRERVRWDPSWRPNPARFTANPRAIEDALEAEMGQYLRDNFISMGLKVSTYVLKQTLIMLVQSFVASGDLPESALNFKCSTTYVRRF